MIQLFQPGPFSRLLLFPLPLATQGDLLAIKIP